MIRTDETRASASPRGGPLVLAFLAGLLGGAASVALLPGRSGPSEPAPASSGLESLDRHVQELTREFSALRAAAALPAPRSELAPGAPVESLHPAADAGLAALVARLDELLARSSSLGASSLPSIVIPDPKVTEAARRALIQAEPEDVKGEIVLMNYQQIVERFGRPDAVYANDNGSVNWVYIDAATNAQRYLTFVDGLVLNWR